MQTLTKLFTVISICSITLAQQPLILDNFEDNNKNLIAKNYAYWQANSYAQSAPGQILSIQNTTDATGNHYLSASLIAGTGSWRSCELMLKFSWDEQGRQYKPTVPYGLDLSQAQTIRFRAKASPAIHARLQLTSDAIPNYQYYYAPINLTENWKQYEIPLATFTSDQSAIPLIDSLKQTDTITLAAYPPENASLQLAIDDLELIYQKDYQPPQPPKTPTGLKQAADKKNIKIGIQPMAMHLTDTTLMQTIDDNAHVLMGSWETCQTPIQRSPNFYDFAQADALLQWAQDHHKTVKAQHLIWHGGTPDWIKNKKFTPAQLDQLMKTFIEKSISHYKTNYPNVVTHYSVVNEAIDDNTKTYRSSVWYDTLGPDFIAHAFRYAHAADPNAKLYYNDYGIDTINPKSDAVYALLQGLLKDNVPIHGVGLQMHIFDKGYTPDKQSLLDNIARFGKLGLEVYITEADVAINYDETGISPEKLTQQAGTYRTILEAAIESPYCNEIAFWGITDKYTWIPSLKHHNDWPLLLDENYQPKPAWHAILETLQQQ